MLKIGLSATCETEVTEQNTAQAMGSGNLQVFATPAMIALMEAAAVKCVSKHLQPSQTTVGVLVNISHLKASAIGEKITATAKIIDFENRKITFAVEANDSKGNIVGKGRHERFIVDAEKFMNKTKSNI